MRSTKTRLSAVLVTLLLTLGITAPAAADHSEPHTAAQDELERAQQAYEDAESVLLAAEALLAAADADLADERQAVEDARAAETATCEDEGSSNKDCNDARKVLRDAEKALEAAADDADLEGLADDVADAEAALEAAEQARDDAQRAVDETASAGDDTDPPAQVDLVDEVDICHATNSAQNPYNAMTVSVRSIINLPNGHDDHENDIIPPFRHGDPAEPSYFEGMNWDTDGQATWNTNCGQGGFERPVPTVTVADDEICAEETHAIEVLLDNPTGASVTFLGTLSIDGTPVAAGNYLDHTVAAETDLLFEGTAPAPATYAVTWQAFADYDADQTENELLASGSFTITATDCSDPDPDPDPEPDGDGSKPTVYELEAVAQEVCLPDDLREVIALELDGRNVTSADVELQDADGNTLDTVINLNLNASPHQLDWPVDGEGELYAEVTLIVTSPQRPQLEVEPIVLTLDDVALEDCTAVGGVVDENPEPEPEPQPEPEPEPEPADEDEDEVEVRDVVVEREVPVARGHLPRTGVSTVALVMTGLLSLLTGGALLRSGRREEDAS